MKLKLKIGDIVIPLKGPFKGKQCEVISMSEAGLIYIICNNSKTAEWRVDLIVLDET
jgi:ribosomal protein L24